MPARIFTPEHGGETPERRQPKVVTTRSTFAALVLAIAVVGGLVGVINSNPRHSLAQAAAATPPALSATSTAASGSTGTSESTSNGLSLGVVPDSVVPRPVAAAPSTRPVSQGQVGVIPVPLAPKADAGPIPLIAWQAYHQAAAASGCQLPWYVLAGIGKVESDHGRFHGAQYDVIGTVHPAIFGPPTAYGRAMGPMQFIPPTWATYAADGNHDGTSDPQNIFDATAAAAHYLCNAGGPNLSGLAAQRRAVFAYNHLDSYVADVLAFAAAYEHGQPEHSVHLVPITYPKAATKAPAVPTRRAAPTSATTKPTTSAAVATTTPRPTSAPTTVLTTKVPVTTLPATTAPATTAPATTAPATTAPATTSPPTTTAAPTTAPTCATATSSPSSKSPTSAPPTTCVLPTCPSPTTTPSATRASTSAAATSTSASPSTAPTCVAPTATPTGPADQSTTASERARINSGGRLKPSPSAS